MKVNIKDKVVIKREVISIYEGMIVIETKPIDFPGSKKYTQRQCHPDIY